jgi:hypothetical protein
MIIHLAVDMLQSSCIRPDVEKAGAKGKVLKPDTRAPSSGEWWGQSGARSPCRIARLRRAFKVYLFSI